MANKSDQIYITCFNRDDQYLIVVFNGSSTPHNSISYSTEYIPSNTIKRASVGSSVNNSNDSDGVIFKEYFSSRTCTGDPTVGDGLNWVWDATTSGPTDLAYLMGRLSGLLPLNTKY